MQKALQHNPGIVTPAQSAFALDALGVAGLLYLGALTRIPLPFTPTPLTLQTLVVLVAPYLLGRNRAFAGIALYLALGMTTHITGVALFAAASGVTYGYLVGFLLAPLLMARFPRTPAGVAAATTAAAAMILILGAVWLHFFLGVSWGHALALGAVPFIPGDLLKVAAACALVRRMRIYNTRS